MEKMLHPTMTTSNNSKRRGKTKEKKMKCVQKESIKKQTTNLHAFRNNSIIKEQFKQQV